MAKEHYDWRSALKSALRCNRRDAHNRYLQLATVRPDGAPAVRTLVYRGFQDSPARLDLVTDARSEKVTDIAGDARGEICWYLTRTREQFRLRGALAVSGPDASEAGLRNALWSGLSHKARAQFFWPHPARPVAENAAPSPEDTGSPPDCFLALSLHVVHVDHLCLRGDPQRRFRSVLEKEGWVSEAINP